MYKVKDISIIKEGKLYKKGDEFPYEANDKHLLYNLVSGAKTPTKKKATKRKIIK